MFSCDYCEIFKSSFFKTSPVAPPSFIFVTDLYFCALITYFVLICFIIVLQKHKLKREARKNRILVEKVARFYYNKLENWQAGFYQLYYATKVVFDIGNGENDGIVEKEEL